MTSPFITVNGELNQRLLNRVFAKLGISFENERTLDIGCGTGILSDYFAKSALYIGIDLVSQPGLAAFATASTTFGLGNAETIPLKDESINLVVCLDSFEHYLHPLKAAKEFYRVLKPNGTLFLSIPNYANIAGLVKRVSERYGAYERDSWAPFDAWKPQALEHFVTPATVKRLFGNAGFCRFNKVGYADEMIAGLFPWIWHPAFPEKLKVALWRINKVLAGPVVALWPSSSLHLFWKISKL